MIEEHLLVLQVAIPLVAAPICLLLRRRRLVAGFAILTTLVAFALSLLILHRVLDSGPFSYMLGAWPAPLGIEYRVDLLNAFVLVLVSAWVLTLLVSPVCKYIINVQ